MIKVVKKDWDEINEGYTLSLENGDTVFIAESNYDLIQTHTSSNGKQLKAIVNEHEDKFAEPIEYLGFDLIS